MKPPEFFVVMSIFLKLMRGKCILGTKLNNHKEGGGAGGGSY